MLRNVGFDIVYPDGCSNIDSSLPVEELRKNMNELNAALREMLRETGLTDESMQNETDIQSVCTPDRKPIRLTGLLLHLLSPQFTHHPDIDIRLRNCVAVCSLLKLFCPTNPFEIMHDCQSRIKSLLGFLNESISHLCDLRSKHAVHYPRLFTIIYNCCKLDIFAWCRLLDDGEKCLLEILKTLLSITKNINVWAWSDETTVKQFLLDTLATLLHQSPGLLTAQVVAYLLSFLIEPAKSSQPVQHAIVKELIVRAAPQLEYPIQMLIQNSLVTSDQMSPEKEHTPHDILGEHTFILIYALYTLQESLVTPILPCIEVKLKSNNARERKRAFRLLTRIFAEPNSTLHIKYPELWASFLSRFQDIETEVRTFCIQMVPIILKQNSEIPRESLLSCIESCTLDKIESVRLAALKTTINIMHESKDGASPTLFEIVHNRSRDKALSIRKEALCELAQIYKRNLKAVTSDFERMAAALNAIMHMYYQPDNDDKITVERLFKSCIVPYDFATKERVESLFTCYQLADDATIRSIQELLKIQFTGSTLVRDALRIVIDNQGKRIVGQASVGMIQRMQKLAGLLPKPEKALDHLKKFFNSVHVDRVLRATCCRLFQPECSATMAVQCIRALLKRAQNQQKQSAPTASTDNSSSACSYEHSVKLLLERCSSVLFDEAFGQELLTRLVVSMDTGGSVELIKGLRILLALSVYHKDVLPADDVLQYIGNFLGSPKVLQNVDSPTKSTIAGEKDPSTAVELCLQILCCLLGGGPINGVIDSRNGVAVAAGLSAEGATSSTLLLEMEGQNKSHNVGDADDVIVTPSHCRLYSGSPEQLADQATAILPILANFSTSGLTADCPPVETVSQTLMTAQAPKGQRRKKAAKEAAAKEVDVEAAAGLAWRCERRRAKLSMRVLRQLLTVAHSLAGGCSHFPRGPVSSLKQTTEDSPPHPTPPLPVQGDGDEDAESMAKLEKRVQEIIDSIVKACLACELGNVNYIACLTSLSHVAILFPGIYNPQLKTLMTGHLIPNLLTRDSITPAEQATAVPKAPRRKSLKTTTVTMESAASPADWTPDGCVSLLTRAKIVAIKLMTNWLVGLKLHNRQVTQVVIRLIHRIIAHDGDLTCQGKMSYGDMSRMRLVAAISWLKIAHHQVYVEAIEVAWYQSMSYVLCDPCPKVRSQFLTVLHNGLLDLKLPLEYMAMFVHAADSGVGGVDSAFRLRVKQCLLASVKRRRAFLARHASITDNSKLLFALLPDFVLAYAIHLLAHDPDWHNPRDAKRLSVVKSSLWFILEPIMAGGNNYTFLRQMLEKIKHSQDALFPDDQEANEKIYLACDIALCLLLTRSTNIVWKGCQFEIKLPRTLFLRAPSNFSNPDFAQISGSSESATPLLTFTPLKNSKAVKDGLIPAKFIRTRSTNKQTRAPVQLSEGSSSSNDDSDDNDVDLDGTDDSKRQEHPRSPTTGTNENCEAVEIPGVDTVVIRGVVEKRNSDDGMQNVGGKRRKHNGADQPIVEVHTNSEETKQSKSTQSASMNTRETSPTETTGKKNISRKRKATVLNKARKSVKRCR